MPNDTADIFAKYLVALRETPIDQQTEHSSRGALKVLLDHFRPAKSVVTHEPKRAQAKGAPDFKIAQAGQIVGYVENKAVGENLDAVLKSDQIKKYQALSPNLLITDYLRWVWLKDGKVMADTRLGEAALLEDRKAQARPERVFEVEALIRNFFSQPPQGIARAKALAEALAVRSQMLRDYLGEELVRQKDAKEGGQLIGLFGAFEKQVSHEITLEEFADAFAQTLAYGLFLAKLNDPKGDTITLGNAKTFVPQSVGLIRELVGFLDNLDREEYADIKWVVEEVLSIINGLDVASVQEDLSFRNRKAKRGTRAGSEEEWRLFSRDPFIYFYEDFLAKYDQKLRKQRGVYYTPPPIVNFIVRAVNDILKDTFGIAQGLADRKRVTVLDFACGTGTFLVEVLERIFEEVPPESGKAQGMVAEHVLKNIFGFEYLIAPYTIAHLKLGQYLAEKGFALKGDQRFQVYLTNTLEPIAAEKNYLVPELSHETELAQAVKEKPILVITGNPPYSGHSRNNGSVAKGRIERYKQVWETDAEGREQQKPLGEKNPKWLQDDYVKFIAFAEEKMIEADEGVVGIITNHSFLDNPTFRGMRQSLMRTFDQIHVIDLHGNAKKKEVTPDGSKDENVFDIEQGVAISLLIKKPGIERGVWRGDVWGKRQEKYEWGAGEEARSLTRLQPQNPQWLWVVRDNEAASAYEEFWKISEMFLISGMGIVTAHDEFSISTNFDDLLSRYKKFKLTESNSDLLHELFKVKRKTGWDILKGHSALVSSPSEVDDYIHKLLYQPFDRRFIFYEDNLIWRPTKRVMDHMRSGNLSIVTNRSQEIPGMWSNILVTDEMAVHHAVSSKEINYQFPLYLYPPPEGSRRPKAQAELFGDGTDPFEGKERIENVASDFRQWLDARLGGEPASPEDILGYIYAVLHAPAYRCRYADFLRTDFPRVPFPESRADFDKLAALGWALVQAHLLKDVPKRGLGAYSGKGSDAVEKPRYDAGARKLCINPDKYFADVPEPVWHFTIGGYQVLDKWLKSRKGRTLSLDEQEHLENVINVLDFTIEQMELIDEAFLAFSQ